MNMKRLACALLAGGSLSAQAAPADLVGEWLCVDEVFEQRLSLRADGSYTNTPMMMGQVVLEQQGNWTFEDETLVLQQTLEIKRGASEAHQHRLEQRVSARTPQAFTRTHENASGSAQVSACTRS
ncbi:MAG: hypothetical protein V4812_01445 [Pseudomonadota bacterium]